MLRAFGKQACNYIQPCSKTYKLHELKASCELSSWILDLNYSYFCLSVLKMFRNRFVWYGFSLNTEALLVSCGDSLNIFFYQWVLQTSLLMFCVFNFKTTTNSKQGAKRVVSPVLYKMQNKIYTLFFCEFSHLLLVHWILFILVCLFPFFILWGQMVFSICCLISLVGPGQM